MKKLAPALVVISILLTGCDVSINSGPKKSSALEARTSDQQMVVVEAAEAFLRQLDTGAAADTWRTASPYLHKLTNETLWSSGLLAFRKAVGVISKRKPKGAGFTRTINGVPEGDYAVVFFDSIFERATGEEKVVLHNDQGNWKVIGYFLNKKFEAQL